MVREFDFYIIPTPIGNIQDITFRAVEVLKSVDLIACEDTRTTQKLLNHYDIKTKCISYHKYNEKERVEFFLKELSEGKKIALVSDAGTPMICDPGEVIVSELQKNGYSVTSLPGACAITTFLSQAPKNGEQFTFIGFMPRTEEQIKTVIEKYSSQNLVFYDSPERIVKTLRIIYSALGNIKVSIGRELTKLFEEVLTDDISNIIKHFEAGVKGEIVCMLHPSKEVDFSEITEKIKDLKSKNFKDKEISVILSTLFGYNKNEVYKTSVKLSN